MAGYDYSKMRTLIGVVPHSEGHVKEVRTDKGTGNGWMQK